MTLRLIFGTAVLILLMGCSLNEEQAMASCKASNPNNDAKAEECLDTTKREYEKAWWHDIGSKLLNR